MKIRIDIDITPDEAKELWIPSEKQTEFMTMVSTEIAKTMTKQMSNAQWPWMWMNTGDQK